MKTQIFDETNLKNSLEKICEDKTYSWRDCLIACPDNIYYCGNDKFPNSYEIELWKRKGKNAPEKYGDAIKKSCKRMCFEWNEEYKGYYLVCNDITILMERLKQLNEEISEVIHLCKSQAARQHLRLGTYSK